MTKDHSVTIGITSFNCANTLGDAILSALAQDANLLIKQIIIVDDASTDSSYDIAVSYASQDARIQVFRNSFNQGVARSRNIIVDHCTSEYLAFFDDDDISLPERVRCQLSALLEYYNTASRIAPVLCHAPRIQVFPNGFQRVEQALGTGSIEALPGEVVLRYALNGEPLSKGKGSCATCSQMARSSVYRDLGGFNPELRRCEDFDLALRVAEAGGYFVGTDKPLVIQKMTISSEKSTLEIESYNLLVLELHRYSFFSHRHYRLTVLWHKLKYTVRAGRIVACIYYLARLMLMNPYLTMTRLLEFFPSLHDQINLARHASIIDSDSNIRQASAYRQPSTNLQ